MAEHEREKSMLDDAGTLCADTYRAEESEHAQDVQMHIERKQAREVCAAACERARRSQTSTASSASGQRPMEMSASATFSRTPHSHGPASPDTDESSASSPSASTAPAAPSIAAISVTIARRAMCPSTCGQRVSGRGG
eukprot:994048-Rhodomonas_salina.1